MPLPPSLLFGSYVEGRMARVIAMMMYREGFLRYYLNLSPKVLDVSPMLLPLKWVCIPYLPHIFLILLQRLWVYDITIWPLVLISLVTGWVPVVPWTLAPSLTSLDDLVSLSSTLSKAHLRYLQLVSVFLRCSISFWRSLGLLQAVLALWVRVLMTQYLAERPWWLSHCK